MTKKQYKQNILLVILSIFLILIIVFIVRIALLLRKPTDTMIVRNGELIKYEDVVGYVIRNEEILDTSSFNGTINVAIPDGNRVAKDGVVSTYISNNERNLIQKISEVDVKIQEAMDNQQGILNNDVKLLDSDIKTKLYDVIKNKNDVYTVSEFKNNINDNIQKKAKIVGELSPAGSKLKELINERLKFEVELNNSKQTLKSSIAGLVSYRVDGYEEMFNPSNLGSLSSKALEKVKINVGQLIPIDTSKIKVVDNFYCYIAIPMNSEESKELKLDDRIKLRFDNTGDEIIQGSVEYISEEEKNRIIVVKITSNVEELSKYRKINLDVVWWRDTGLKVPDSAIKYVDVVNSTNGNIIRNIPTVSIKKSAYTETAYIKIIREANGFSIVENYTDEELLNLGLDEGTVSNRQTLKLYDDVILQ